MGHERIGHLPKTSRWRDVVHKIADLCAADIEVSEIVNRTLQNVNSRFRNINKDDGVKAAFHFLVILAMASRSPSPQKELLATGIKIPEQPTLLSFAKAVHEWVNSKSNSPEYAQIAPSAAADAMAIWYEQNKPKQQRLFELSDDPFDTWRKAGGGAGFCDLARLFFAKLTERYLNYFLEREASSALYSLEQRELFREQIEKNIDGVSRHAFETAKITQSFAAGWFNRHSKLETISEQEIENFMGVALGKIREELRREGSER